MNINNFLSKFFHNLKIHNIYGHIEGGKCLEYHLNKCIDTFDYDIALYVDNIQLNNKDTFNIIYENLIKLYEDLKTIYNVLPYKKMSYSNLYKKYLPKNIICKEEEYFNHHIICDFYVETNDYKTLIDLHIKYSYNISIPKSYITCDYYLDLDTFILHYKKYYEDLLKKYKYSNKINIVKNRLYQLSHNIKNNTI